ncbi:MAG: hypothetical protein A3H42_02615 [Deltaproteobacteria bacterium RIFCSPLOWO2_02_FULL_46_8]|nr:MAG: hypothetical protein A3H42_02615 [Deltaproteobacteria bacterium RIFCSPLOWO2_02_FULL_46_8]
MKKITISLFCLMGLLACSKNSGGDAAAIVNGETITITEIDQSAGGRIAKQVYEMRKGALDDLIDQRLLEAAAAKKKVSVDELVKQEVEVAVTEPTDQEIQAIYDANKEHFGNEPFDKLKPQIANSLKQNRKNIQKEQFLAKLKQDAKIETKLIAPPVTRVKVEKGDAPAIGPNNAPITIIEFTDFQCPFCGRARPTVNQILETYKDKVQYALRDFPLAFHQDAMPAHMAAHCAGEQGKYWEYSKILFGNQTSLKSDKLKEYSKQVGLDTKKFDECVASNKYAATIQKNIDEASKAGVTGTPSFFINGIMISGAQPFPKFKEIIDAELKK